MIPYEQLVQQIDHTDQGSEIYRELKAEFWRRYAVALTPFIFVFLGIGYGTIRTRSVRAGATLVAFVVLVVYWALQAWSTVAAQKGQVPPWLAMEIPNLVILLAAIRGFRSAIW
jgi:lipopolysaccharide export LptBFGC system permease protein LptF